MLICGNILFICAIWMASCFAESCQAPFWPFVALVSVIFIESSIFAVLILFERLNPPKDNYHFPDASYIESVP